MRLLAFASVLALVAGCTSSSSGRGGGGFGHVQPPSFGPDEPALRFVAVGDTGTGQEPEYLVAQAIGEKCAADGCDFILILGDLVYPEGVTSVDDPDWKPKVEDPYESLGIPIRPVLGNHDYGENGDDFERARWVVERSDVDPLWHMPAAHYRVDGDLATLAVLDTNLLIFDLDSAMNAQGSFASSAFAEARGWKISAGHHPYRSNGDHGDAIGNVKTFYESSICGTADLILSAHDHTRQVLPGDELCPATMVVSGAGSNLGTLPGGHDASFESDALGFAYIAATEDVLRIEMLGTDAEPEFATEMTR